MRKVAAFLAVSAIALPALVSFGLVESDLHAQSAVPTPSRSAALAAKKKAAPAPKGAPAGPRPDSYTGMALSERVGVQFDLAWLGDYNGLITGEFNDKAVAAVKAFQKRNKFKETGTLAAQERALLAAASKSRQAQVGWTMVDDKVTGAVVGLPTKQVPNATTTKSGTRWSSAQGQVQAETFRIREPGTTLAAVFEAQKKDPATRKIEVNLLRPDFFILSGTQGLKKFYVRAEIRDGEVRGLTTLWDPATETIMDPVVVVMSSAFAPFPGSGLAALIGPPPRRKVEYGTGIVVSSEGHIITDRRLTEGCSVLQVAGFGDANRVAEDAAAELVLLRVYGAPNLTPAALTPEAVRTGDLTLVGIADPQAQNGGNAVSSSAAKLNGDALQPAPQPGFAGAAALDNQGRFFGMVQLKTPVVASAGTAAAPAQAIVVPAATIRRFLEAQQVAPAAGRAGLEPAKAALARVICVRK